MSKKLLSVIIVVIVVAGAIIAYLVTRKKAEGVLIVEEGDFVTVSYTVRLNETGELVNIGTINFTVGEGALLERKRLEKFDYQILNMSVGETKEFILEPWDAFGNWSWGDVINISVLEKISKFEDVKKAEFEAKCPNEPISNYTVFTHWVWNWNSTIIDLRCDETGNITDLTIEHLRGSPAPNESYIGLVIQSTEYGWNSTVYDILGGNISLKHNAVIGMNTTLIGKRKGKVLNITNETMDLENQEIVVDLNHELAGKTLKFEVTIVDIKKKGA